MPNTFQEGKRYLFGLPFYWVLPLVCHIGEVMGISLQVQEVLVDLEEAEALADLVEVDLAVVVPGDHGNLYLTKIIKRVLAGTWLLSCG